jgi:hypothetical protein
MKIKSSSARGNFKIINGNWELAQLQFEKWYSHKAIATYRAQRIEIRPTGFWGTKYEIIRNGREIGTIAFNWTGTTALRLKDTHGDLHQFTFKPTGTFKLRFEMYNEKDDLVLTMNADSKWYDMGMSFSVEKTEHEPPFDEVEFLIYCGYIARIQLAQMGAS